MTVSSITGRRQGPWLRSAMWVIGTLALVGIVVPGTLGTVASGAAVILLTAVPLLRVVWVVVRLAGERDRRFVIVGVALLSAVAFGVLISVFLRG
ncbi:MAG TPA: hypothetical protein VMS74_06490 [Acidimicrobiia bacterium]|nr:hypothetical protein [Acidimicrobiia bacterium]